MEYTAKGLPKVIHYCWFGRGEKSPLIQRCIATWREKRPGWEIQEWNEDNFDVESIPYTAEAYGAKKYAFVADYARFWILYHFGGVCLCTDVELLRPVDDLLDETPYLMGFELRDTINPGSIISALPEHQNHCGLHHRDAAPPRLYRRQPDAAGGQFCAVPQRVFLPL